MSYHKVNNSPSFTICPPADYGWTQTKQLPCMKEHAYQKYILL